MVTEAGTEPSIIMERAGHIDATLKVYSHLVGNKKITSIKNATTSTPMPLKVIFLNLAFVIFP